MNAIGLKRISIDQVISKTIFASGLFIAVCLLSGCRQLDVFEKNTTIPDMEWSRQFAATGSFDITDTAAFYNIYIVLRHTDAYEWNNIWLEVGVKSPGDTMQFQKMDLTLGSDRSGWEGTGMNDIWEVRKQLFGEPRRFVRPGRYEFSIRHIMRHDPLRYVMSAGMRVEKAP